MCWELFANVTVEPVGDRVGVPSGLVAEGQDDPGQFGAGSGATGEVEAVSAPELLSAMGAIAS